MTHFYIKNGGSDAASGNSWANAWLTTTKANDVIVGPPGVADTEITIHIDGLIAGTANWTSTNWNGKTVTVIADRGVDEAHPGWTTSDNPTYAGIIQNAATNYCLRNDTNTATFYYYNIEFRAVAAATRMFYVGASLNQQMFHKCWFNLNGQTLANGIIRTSASGTATGKLEYYDCKFDNGGSSSELPPLTRGNALTYNLLNSEGLYDVNLKFSRCYFNANVSSGIFIRASESSGTGHTLEISDCHFYGSYSGTNTIIYSEGTTNPRYYASTTITGNIFENVSCLAINTKDTNALIISSNTFTTTNPANASFPVLIGSGGVGTTSDIDALIGNITCQNNVFNHTSGAATFHGISIKGKSGKSIGNISLTGNSGTNLTGYLFDIYTTDSTDAPDCGSITISNNTATTCKGLTKIAYHANGVTIQNNTLTTREDLADAAYGQAIQVGALISDIATGDNLVHGDVVISNNTISMGKASNTSFTGIFVGKTKTGTTLLVDNNTISVSGASGSKCASIEYSPSTFTNNQITGIDTLLLNGAKSCSIQENYFWPVGGYAIKWQNAYKFNILNCTGTNTFQFTAPNTLAVASYNFTTNNYVAGEYIEIKGTTNNNGWYTIGTVGTTTLTLVESVVNEGPLSSTASLRNGSNCTAETITDNWFKSAASTTYFLYDNDNVQTVTTCDSNHYCVSSSNPANGYGYLAAGARTSLSALQAAWVNGTNDDNSDELCHILTVTPSTGVSATAEAGGLPDVESETYTLTNTGIDSVDWTATTTSSWLNFSSDSGSLNAGFYTDGTNTTEITVTLDASDLDAGEYSGTVVFADDSITFSRLFSLIVSSIGEWLRNPLSQMFAQVLSGDPVYDDLGAYVISNEGTGTLQEPSIEYTDAGANVTFTEQTALLLESQVTWTDTGATVVTDSSMDDVTELTDQGADVTTLAKEISTVTYTDAGATVINTSPYEGSAIKDTRFN